MVCDPIRRWPLCFPVFMLLMFLSHLLATGPELPTDYSLKNTSDLTHSLTLWKTDLSLPRTILWKTPLIYAALVNKLVPCAWLLNGAFEWRIYDAIWLKELEV